MKPEEVGEAAVDAVFSKPPCLQCSSSPRDFGSSEVCIFAGIGQSKLSLMPARERLFHKDTPPVFLSQES